jgi:predicted RNA-binding protein YlqC (UPF0109 family)
MDESLRYVVGKLVEHPDEVAVSHREDQGKTTYLLELNRGDIGRLIGKGGATIKAIRDLLSAAAGQHGKKVGLEILE